MRSLQVYVQAKEGRGCWAGFQRDEWHKGRLLALLRGKDGVHKTLDFRSVTRTGQHALCSELQPGLFQNHRLLTLSVKWPVARYQRGTWWS